MRSLGRGLRRRFFFAGGQSWRVEGKSSASWEDDGVRYRDAGSGEDKRDDGTELKSETSETSQRSEYMAWCGEMGGVEIVTSSVGRRGEVRSPRGSFSRSETQLALAVIKGDLSPLQRIQTNHTIIDNDQ